MRKSTIVKIIVTLILLGGVIVVFNLYNDGDENVPEKKLRSIEVVSVEPERVAPGTVSVITFVTKGSDKALWLKDNDSIILPNKYGLLEGSYFTIRPNMSGGKILSIERGQKPGYYIVQYQSPTNPFFTSSYPVKISIGLERYRGYERRGRVFVALEDVATVTVLNPSAVEDVDITLKRTGDLGYTGGGVSLYKGACEKTEDCKAMYNFVPWNTKDGAAIQEQDAVQLECTANQCILPATYRAIGVWCNAKSQCDTRRIVKKNLAEYPELTCDTDNERCIGADTGVNCIIFNRDQFVGPIDIPAVERCDIGLLCDDERGACEYDFGISDYPHKDSFKVYD
ncbi:MAG: hypothetical protein A2249_03900 [Candidatus Jacksonbacteria bacterium RIFOXYA2_FULL_44_7]|uniref:Uncharacterized protein n=1 Tax=Candidatus Jacksonbacteria bacterium RIFCSPLOWO2_02_FULL_44_20 TaxID=1798460 RepID=A0A1G2A7W3_9BACT|nr:MAG: hypothetical protein UW39_C0007G0027 [Parcubacteria group bacterium GW2011_GWC2_44_17]KKT48322.1 MAG: hypothetical protein UW40_C0047G0016 [Parcubacteria group bacterium GW2011_GWF2_44_17]OGY71657.1 MAG: hypothetical protein A3C00_00065 [Candidatus Jacksonbacteria bacterium RIFCSPHIGHO2_02_FULL_44_25]OGY72978.1 MAG: hypothetical protein A3H61_04060 [Candidatus Jacksonbacteria bacterium RIFCSPLOWO2_02_FULL_44_20]OGY75757.1 MAG: hypothetical protein A2249_03900 [Candidatus Jacksonbacteria